MHGNRGETKLICGPIFRNDMPIIFEFEFGKSGARNFAGFTGGIFF